MSPSPQTLFLLLLWTHGPVLSAVRHGLPIQEDRLPSEVAGPAPSLSPELAFLVDAVGQNRLWLIVAPSRSDSYLRMMEQQIQDMEAEGLNCRLAARDTVILTIIQNAMMEGTLRRHSSQGTSTEETLDPETVSRLLHHLQVPEQTFCMVILKKNLQESVRFPYPVRVQAVLEAIDQMPLRKLERLTGKAPPVKCKVSKKKGQLKKKVQGRGFSALRGRNLTVVARQRKPLDRKSALRSKVQDILRGQSRFVIRKGSPRPKVLPGPTQQPVGETATRKDSASWRSEGNMNGNNQGGKGAQKRDGVNSAERSGTERSSAKSTKKGKGKKERKKKKEKGRGRKLEQNATEKERKVLRAYLEKHRERRRLLVIGAPSKEAPQYIQQRSETEKHGCELGLRNVSVVTVLGDATVSLQHCIPEAESCQQQASEESTNQELISQLRGEYALLPETFHVVLTDYDLKPTKGFDSPVTGTVLMDHVDALPSRQAELGRGRTAYRSCPRSQDQDESDKSLLRFVSKRRLLIISAPSEDDYSFQQQLQALDGQACPLGIRHFALLKLVGEGPSASGFVELFPLNGKSQTEVERLSTDSVNGLREQLKISRDYFSMAVVGKGGDVSAWFPTPMWSMASIYDLVDSTELRQQEQKLQVTLGIVCPEDNGGRTEDIGEENYLYSRSED
uniref:Coiled-coil domain containing 80 like 2 n=1 Tax=Paramormyrops kingsleyae TaxID=1676925 RepID=A0A3B3Q8U7_9TELE|nr:coiled-coil domain-containing protein 80-like [Paramormyrops kingsleyae]